ncbi:MFS transporter [Saccharothrix deserti]|uniref:MFS transporter n=1 Tax=Saccharothrix deserti TaxID=2593674 RepID=UPI00131A9AFA|nr:MFS transporter [Saccharothrix deserti]
MIEEDRVSYPGSAGLETPDSPAGQVVVTPVEPPPSREPGDAEPPRLTTRYVWLLVLACTGAWMAYIAPMAYSLAIRIDQIAPGRDEYLGYLTGVGGIVALLANPFVGVLSDRTRSRLGRRRPYLIAGTLVGMPALFVLGVAPDIAVLTIGWVLAVLGWQAVMGGINFLVADKVPQRQRGWISGITGCAHMVAPVLGIGLATTVVGDNLLLLLLPGVVGLLLLMPLLIWTQDHDSRSIPLPEGRLSARRLFGNYVFNPRQHPDFAWNWLGRFVFYVGMTFNTTFMTFFLAQRLGVPVERIGGTVAAIAGAGVPATMIGALGGGFLSDRLRRRRVLVLLAGGVFCLGAVLMVVSGGLVLLVVGSALTSLGLGAFSAVDQAIVLDVLPSRTEAGRFISIVHYAQQIPHAVAPLFASALLGIGAVAGEKNYNALYLAGGALTLVGGLIILVRVKGSR